jgi:hypothetical protein
MEVIEVFTFLTIKKALLFWANDVISVPSLFFLKIVENYNIGR